MLVIFNTSAHAQQQQYPRMTGYFSITNPIATWNKDGITTNFSDSYNVSFPFGLNLLKSDHFGVSFEVAPVIHIEKNIAKVSSVVFHPGAMFRFNHSFTFISRVAFETNGRFGVTPVLNKVFIRNKDSFFFVAASFPARFGNNLPTSLGSGIQLGVGF
ncbi:hypothetical protein [Mucilaginibacter polytrichastri]|uniref:hypothetical protein n=1 Tax=Mucilaginibacter polytrichastri TaxID=1302689 RepID=UPI001115268E|nr:hypothetical protein [Mucilaginibacter polytrichastri]